MKRQYQDLGSASDQLNHISLAAKPIRRPFLRFWYVIFALGSQMSFCGETSGGITKCWLFSRSHYRTAEMEIFVQPSAETVGALFKQLPFQKLRQYQAKSHLKALLQEKIRGAKHLKPVKYRVPASIIYEKRSSCHSRA